MGETTPFFSEIKTFRNPVVDIPMPSIIYRNGWVTNAFVIYNNIMRSYVPRILANITKYNIVKWILGYMGIRYEWLIMILLIIL